MQEVKKDKPTKGNIVMNSRERIIAAINHKTPDKVPLDFGSGPTTGISAALIYKLRQAFGLPEKPIKLTCSYQMLGEIEDDLAKCLNIDTVKVMDLYNMYGFENRDWKPWNLSDGTPVLVPGKFNTIPDAKGNIYNYPIGDMSVPPSAVMPKDGLYFDAINRQHEIDDDNLNVEDNLEEFTPFSDEYMRFTQDTTREAYERTDRAIMGSPGGCALGDIALVPGVNLKDPKGIRNIEEWYISILLRKDYLTEVFDRQSDMAVENLKVYKEAVGDRISMIYLCGNDFGTQNAPFCSADVFNEVYLPYYRKMTDWIHANTNWKVFKHSCGSIEPLINSFIEAGFDILNPVQCSAFNMDAKMLKQKYGERIVFWGGGVDTQHTLPFGTPDDVRAQVKERVEIFKDGGGFVFNTIHNSQTGVPVENFMAMLETFEANR